MNDFNQLIKDLGKGKILLIGDIMLDQYIKGTVRKISPEGPIPVLNITSENQVLGGTGNVLANLCALGVKAICIGLIGNDDNGQIIRNKISSFGANTDNIISNDEKPTIVKTRFVSQNQQLLRVDRENTATISTAIKDDILTRAKNEIHDASILILSDYGKGLLSPDLIQSLIHMAKDNNVPVLVDPKGSDYTIYKGATIITPNRNELSQSTNNMATATDNDIEIAANILIQQCHIDYVFATRSEDGISVIPRDGTPTHLRTKSIEVYDVSGAGDTVVAVTAAALAAGGDLIDAAKIANIAGALVVAKSGTATVTVSEIENYIQKNAPKILGAKSLEETKDQIDKWQAKGLKVGFTNGCFDILHYGHVNYLARAKEKCDRLVIGLNHDKSVKILKGETRPINDQNARAAVMAALSSVDAVVYFGADVEGGDNTPCAIVDALKPDIFMKGGDYTIDQLPEGKVVQSYGGQVKIMPLYDGYSTTNIIEKSKG